MYCSSASSLLQNLRSVPHPEVPKYDDASLRKVITEINELSPKVEEEMAELQDGLVHNDATMMKLLCHFRMIERNKRAGLAYLHDRCRRLQTLCQKHSGLMPKGLADSLSGDEELFWRRYNRLLTNLNTTYQMNIFCQGRPPLEPEVEVEVLEDLGSIVLPSGLEATFQKGTIHQLRYSDAQKLLSMGSVCLTRNEKGNDPHA
ncbi:hypothetical protein P9112_007655 [Eukaryota sp. TZLM1-RC]